MCVGRERGEVEIEIDTEKACVIILYKYKICIDNVIGGGSMI